MPTRLPRMAAGALGAGECKGVASGESEACGVGVSGVHGGAFTRAPF